MKIPRVREGGESETMGTMAKPLQPPMVRPPWTRPVPRCTLSVFAHFSLVNPHQVAFKTWPNVHVGLALGEGGWHEPQVRTGWIRWKRASNPLLFCSIADNTNNDSFVSAPISRPYSLDNILGALTYSYNAMEV